MSTDVPPTNTESSLPTPNDAKLPLLTFGVFVVLAAILWLNAILDRYLFNVVIALLGSVPVLVLLIRGAGEARAARRDGPTAQ